jgi:hypothetical protein
MTEDSQREAFSLERGEGGAERRMRGTISPQMPAFPLELLT